MVPKELLDLLFTTVDRLHFFEIRRWAFVLDLCVVCVIKGQCPVKDRVLESLEVRGALWREFRDVLRKYVMVVDALIGEVASPQNSSFVEVLGAVQGEQADNRVMPSRSLVLRRDVHLVDEFVVDFMEVLDFTIFVEPRLPARKSFPMAVSEDPL